MRRILSTSLEVLAFIIFLVWSCKWYAIMYEPTQVVWIIGIIVTCAIIIAKIIENLVQLRIQLGGVMGNIASAIVKALISLLLISILFFAAYSAIEYFGHMPASDRLLIFLSVGSAISHIFVSYTLDVIVDADKNSSRKMIRLEYFDEDIYDNEEE